MTAAEKAALIRAARVYALKLERELKEFSELSSFAEAICDEYANLHRAVRAIGGSL